MTGRAGSGRSRPGAMGGQEPEAMMESGEEGGRGIRGRGGGAWAPLRTIPGNISATSGEGGTIIRLLSNYYRLNTPTDQIIYGYHISFEPQVESVRLRRALIYENRQVFNAAYVYDGGNEIKSLASLDNEVTTVTGTRKSDSATITMTIKHTITVTWGHPEMLRLYNTQMRRNLQALGMLQIGRYYYDARDRKRLPAFKLEIWPGIITAINEHDGGIMMVNDVVHKVVRAQTAYEILQEMLKNDRANFRNNARRELPGTIVMAQYNNKTYRIDDVVFDKNPVTCTFERRAGTITVKDYYQEQYQITIRDERQPLLLVKPTERDRRGGQEKPIMLVPELCLMTGLTDDMRNNFNLKREMGNLTRASPVERATTLNNFVRKLNENERVKAEMSAWGIRFEDRIVDLPGRILPAEKIYMQNEGEDGGCFYDQKAGSFEKDIRSKNLRRPVSIDNWAIICQRKDKLIIDEYCNALRRVSDPLGVTMTPPRVVPLDNDRTAAYAEACKKTPKEIKLVNVIVPNNNKERYDAIKKIFCVENPTASQVVTTRVLQKKGALMTVCTKVCIQMAVKLGAEAWALHIPPRNMMIAGFDAYHDSARKGSSVGGFVCSMNQSATRWYSRVSYHQSREEMSGNFALNFKSGLKEYHAKNGRLPDRIVVYRDGVSEGQIPYVYEFEVAQLQKALEEVVTTEKVLWAFVIVTKRVNARFFLKADRTLENPTPGSVVDTVVTRKERYDFYLISQSVRQGTVNPTMYNIIADNTGWRPIHHQQMAYKLCHLYFNWAGTITVPAPCQYAHKLAFLTGTSLHREPDPALAHNLFYL